MLKFIFLSFITIYFSACSGNTTFLGQSDLGQSDPNNDADKKSNSNSDATAEEEYPTAVPPQVITGAYLTCDMVADNDQVKMPNELAGTSEQVYGCGLNQQTGEKYGGNVAFDEVLVEYSDRLDAELVETFAIAGHNKFHFVFAVDQTRLIKINHISASLKVEGLRRSIGSRRLHQKFNCPENFSYIFLSRNTVAGGDFCVSKYEMKEGNSEEALALAAGGPWVDIATDAAADACLNMGDGYRLMNNEDWMATARNIELSRRNWSSGKIGIGSLSHGHSDRQPAEMLAATKDDNDGCYLTGQSCSATEWNAQRRTNILLSGDTIWDFAGNSHELISLEVKFEKAFQRGKDLDSWQDLGGDFNFTADMTREMMKPFRADLSSAKNGIGGYFPGEQNSGGLAQRGGSFGDGLNSGIYALALDAEAGDAHPVTSFRCAWQPEE